MTSRLPFPAKNCSPSKSIVPIAALCAALAWGQTSLRVAEAADSDLIANETFAVRPASPGVIALTGKVAQLLAEQRLAGLFEQLADDEIPLVEKMQELLQAARQHVAAGKEIPADVLLGFRLAVAQAIADRVDDQELERLDRQFQNNARSLQSISRVAAVMRRAQSEDRLDSEQPVMILNPWLARDRMLRVAPGILMIGTDGRGELRLGHGTLAQALMLPVAVGSPLPESSDAKATASNARTLVVNPTGTPLEYSLDGQSATLAPGASLPVTTESAVIAFRSSGRDAPVRYTLGTGSYHFFNDGGKVDLHRVKYRVTIDNSANATFFAYEFEGKNVVVGPHKSKAHESGYPPTIRFDRGAGKSSTRRIANARSTVTPTLNPADNLWDVYFREDVRVPDSPVDAYPIRVASEPQADSAPLSVPTVDEDVPFSVPAEE